MNKRTITSFVALVLGAFITIISLDPAPFAAAENEMQINVLYSPQNAPSRMPAYETEPLTHQEIVDIADKFGLASYVPANAPSLTSLNQSIASAPGPTTTTVFGSSEVLRIKDSSQTLIIFKQTGAYNYNDYSLVGSTHTIAISTDTAIATADTYLSDRGLLGPQTFLHGTGQDEYMNDQDQMQMTEFGLNYGYSSVTSESTIPVVGPGAKLLVSIGQGNEVGMIEHDFPKLRSSGDGNTISANEALDQLRENPANEYEVSIAKIDQINLTTLTVSYYVPVTNKPNRIEPVYVFYGTVEGQGFFNEPKSAVFVGVIPALLETRIPRFMDNPPIHGDEGGIAFDEKGRAIAEFRRGSFENTLTVSVEETQAPDYAERVKHFETAPVIN